tara:strand:- start:274 stop:498 length:225 start_codon:yes stop_codon:yes gene_type:complete
MTLLRNSYNLTKEGPKMPITNKEARNIKDIVNSYIDEEQAREMFKELVEEIAETTDNDSVKQSMLMLHSLYSSS